MFTRMSIPVNDGRGFQHYINRTGVKETRKEGRMMALAIGYTRLQEARKDGAGKGGSHEI